MRPIQCLRPGQMCMQARQKPTGRMYETIAEWGCTFSSWNIKSVSKWNTPDGSSLALIVTCAVFRDAEAAMRGLLSTTSAPVSASRTDVMWTEKPSKTSGMTSSRMAMLTTCDAMPAARMKLSSTAM